MRHFERKTGKNWEIHHQNGAFQDYSKKFEKSFSPSIPQNRAIDILSITINYLHLLDMCKSLYP